MLTSKNHTQQEKLALLNCHRLPGRLSAAEAATLLGIQDHDVAILTAARLLLPLGKPAANAPKYFASKHVAALIADAEWLGNATQAIAAHWQHRNARAGLTLRAQPQEGQP